MGLFDKKYCDICGERIRFLGNRKLSDGNMCGSCADKLSPFLSGRRGMTVEDIKLHLDYRANNEEQIQYFNPTRVVGKDMKVYIDDNQGLLFFSRSSNWKNQNPDLLRFDQITGVTIDIDETRLSREVELPPPPPPPRGGMGFAQGRPTAPVQSPRPQTPARPVTPPQPPRPQTPARPVTPPQPPRPQTPARPGTTAQRPQPPRPGQGKPGGKNMAAPAPGDPMSPQTRTEYYYVYDFKVIVYVNSEWFNEIKFDINSSSIEDSNSVAYQNAYAEAYEYKTVLESLGGTYAEGYQAGETQTAVTCPYCGATTIPDANGCCEYCGGAING